jgi:transcriptional regulator with XRE-family HTH domain
MENTSFQLQRLGKAFRAMRENRGLTQVEAGELAHIPRLAVIKIEAGRETVAIGAYSKLANALGAELALMPRTRPTLEELKDFK